MLPTREIVRIAMDDDGTIADVTGLDTGRGFAADRLGKTKSDKADTSHETHNDTEETDLLAPCTLLLRGANATGRE